jgi:hypothetical protein
MRKIQIFEQDQKYRKDLSDFLIMVHGAKSTEDASVLEVPEELDVDAFHGIKLVDTNAPKLPLIQPAVPFKDRHPEVVEWLNNYKGNFEFYLSLKSQLEAKGSLSEKQVDAVKRAIDKDVQRASKRTLSTSSQTVRLSLSAGEILLISKFFARKLAEQAGAIRPHYVFEVLSVEAETEKAYKVKLRMTAQRTSHCGVCGLTLTNPESVAAGIGPICAENTGISFGANSSLELAEALKETREIDTWLPKSVIKSRLS